MIEIAKETATGGLGAFMFSTLLPLIGTAAAGAAGWLFMQFGVTPYKDLRNIRRKVHEDLFYFGNVGSGTKVEFLQSAQDAFRLSAAKLDALDATNHAYMRWFLRQRGYHLRKASQALTGLSNSLTDDTGFRAELRREIEVGLKLPSVIRPNHLPK